MRVLFCNMFRKTTKKEKTKRYDVGNFWISTCIPIKELNILIGHYIEDLVIRQYFYFSVCHHTFHSHSFFSFSFVQ